MSLANREALPIPDEAAMAAIGDRVGLGEAFGEWHRRHTPPAAMDVVRRQVVRNEGSGVGARRAVAAAPVIALIVLAGLFLRVEVRSAMAGVWPPSQPSAIPAEA